MTTSDLRSAALAVEIAAQRPEVPDWLRQHLLRAVVTLDDCVARLDRPNVPLHWLPQTADTTDLANNVVPLRRRAC